MSTKSTKKTLSEPGQFYLYCLLAEGAICSPDADAWYMFELEEAAPTNAPVEWFEEDFSSYCLNKAKGSTWRDYVEDFNCVGITFSPGAVQFPALCVMRSNYLSMMGAASMDDVRFDFLIPRGSDRLLIPPNNRPAMLRVIR